MKHIRVNWIHQHADEPVVLYSELDAQRLQVRFIEMFRDGSVGYASRDAEVGGTRLSFEPVPALEEIARDPQFTTAEITAEEFEALWRDREARRRA